jgi:uncharacterized damage-inducible protein DinB
MPIETKDTISTMLITQWEQACVKLITLAEHIPQDKYEYRPSKDVRSLADVLRHTAFWNRYVAERCNGKEPDESANEIPKAEYSTQKRILEALRQSLKESVTALNRRATLDESTAELLITFIAHTSEHFGQVVVYARLNGIMPPSSATR